MIKVKLFSDHLYSVYSFIHVSLNVTLRYDLE